MNNKKNTIWLFDLDNTLHNASKAVFPAIANNMTRYIAQVLSKESGEVDMEHVNHLRTEYLRRYGATLKGMVIHHGVKEEEFLREAHRFDNLEQLLHLERGVARVLKTLPGKKILFTNAPQQYSKQVMRQLNLHRDFAGHISIETMRVHGKSHPKPSKAYLRKLLAQHGWLPRQCILVEDSVANLQAAKRIGLRTVMITGHGQHVVQKSVTASADITVKSVFQLARLFKHKI
ncbi:pyrimidine 5'-nucleotidase [Undibacterium sp. LX40W]|uniref:Pyrimidine 5'-nucleotidase n=1 Tax=Undibacterium nitidum TaxID=2762298 RepID=A0A923KV63_9BURK|nr:MULTISPECIES: pyrimidine 5'-nucleotidase [Undibacterium]MBC3882842.1 pyrimidine 5'-nucleotidase [Undibacterium nitidum]MBC3892975.1 pyrimidine 5'-nucleotidase [Undibacterium sp. LX40W]